MLPCFFSPILYETNDFTGVLGSGGAEEHGRVELRPPLHQDEHPQAEQHGEEAALHRQAHQRRAGHGAQQGELVCVCVCLCVRLCYRPLVSCSLLYSWQSF